MIVPGDATSEHAVELRKLVRDMGLESEIFASAIDDSLHSEAMLVHELPDRPLPATLIVYQMSSGSPLAQLALDRKEPLAINYHNLTPDWAYEDWDPAVASDQRWARRQLVDLARRASIGICPSAYNAVELSACGFRETAVCPVLVDMGRLGEFDSTKQSDNRWLFVGRLVPHKGSHRLVEALGIYNQLYGELPGLDLVGSPGPFRYVDAVKRLAHELGVSDSVNFARGVDDVGLGRFYRDAGVFVSASMHEGFCVPIVEAMHSRVPVVALGAAAVPETVGDAGLLVDPHGSDAYLAAKIAAAVHRVAGDSGLRSKLSTAGSMRAEELGLESARRQMRRILEGWIEAQPVSSARGAA
jgi:L-malate glycosyltransferase